MNIEPLVLCSGDHVEIFGVIVRTWRGFGLHASLVSNAVARDGVFGPLMRTVEFEVAPEDETAWAQRLGYQATMRGTWLDRALIAPVLVSAQARVSDGPPEWPSDLTGDNAATLPPQLAPPSAPVDGASGVEPPVVQQIRDAEGPLWASGAMIWRTATGGPQPTRYVAAAHDPEAVAAALTPILGDALTVVPSPWDRQVYLDIESASQRAEDLGLLYRYERGMGDDGVVRVRIGVLQVSHEMADVVRGIPDGPLTVEPFVRRVPHSSGRSHVPGSSARLE